MTPDEEATKLVQEILIGRYNGHLSDIVNACKLVDNGDRVQWRLAVEGLPEVTTQNVTLTELSRVESLVRVPWGMVCRDPLATAKVTEAILVAVLEKREGLDEQAARDRLDGITQDNVVSGFSHFEVDGAPLVQPEPGGPTST